MNRCDGLARFFEPLLRSLARSHSNLAQRIAFSLVCAPPLASVGRGSTLNSSFGTLDESRLSNGRRTANRRTRTRTCKLQHGDWARFKLAYWTSQLMSSVWRARDSIGAGLERLVGCNWRLFGSTCCCVLCRAVSGSDGSDGRTNSNRCWSSDCVGWPSPSPSIGRL